MLSLRARAQIGPVIFSNPGSIQFLIADALEAAHEKASFIARPTSRWARTAASRCSTSAWRRPV